MSLSVSLTTGSILPVIVSRYDSFDEALRHHRAAPSASSGIEIWRCETRHAKRDSTEALATLVDGTGPLLLPPPARYLPLGKVPSDSLLPTTYSVPKLHGLLLQPLHHHCPLLHYCTLCAAFPDPAAPRLGTMLSGIKSGQIFESMNLRMMRRMTFKDSLSPLAFTPL